MLIDMNEVQVRTLEFRSAQDDEERYAWIEQVLRRLTTDGTTVELASRRAPEVPPVGTDVTTEKRLSNRGRHHGPVACQAHTRLMTDTPA